MSKKVKGCLKSNALTLATMAGVLLGVVVGIILQSQATPDDPWTDREVMYVSYVGKIFLQMLKCIIIPLIIPSLIASVGSLDLSLSGKVGGRAVAYYMSTTVLAIILGIILVCSIRPGVGSDNNDDTSESGEGRNVTTADTLMDLVRNCFPPNIVGAAISQYRTVLIYPEDNDNPRINVSNKNTWEFTGEWTQGTNILGLVVFSIVTGIAIASVGEEGKPLLDFFESLSNVMMKVTSWIIFLAPIGVCFLIMGQIMDMEDFVETFGKLGMYFATVLIALFIHGLIVLPSIYGIITKTLPFKFMSNVMSALTTAFGTASSSATLPVTMECLEHKNHIDPRITKFVLPIGATINMDGTALYEAVAAIFIAQVRGKSLSFGGIIAISITATAASIGAAGIPQAGLVTMVMVLDTVGLPADDVALILAVDWLLDRFRTAINVLGDCFGAAIVYHMSKKELEQLPDDSSDDNSIPSIKLNGGSENKAFENTPL